MKKTKMALMFAMSIIVIMSFPAVTPLQMEARTVEDITSKAEYILTPADGETVSGTVTITLSRSMSIYIDDNRVARRVTSYSWDTTEYDDGEHEIYVRYWFRSETITVTVDNGGGPGPTNELQNGVTVYDSLDSASETDMWYIVVDEAADEMHAVLNCGDADFDLYGRLDAEPTTSTYDWYGYTAGGEDVTFDNPGEGIWYIMVNVYDGTGDYDLTVTVTYLGPDPDDPVIEITSPEDGATVSSAGIIWTGYDDGWGIDYYQIRIDGGPWINKGTSCSHVFADADDGFHTVDVQAFDLAGNDAMDSVSFTVDSSQNDVVKYAVIVGISDYKAIGDLSYCDEDATDWYNHLTGNEMSFDFIWVYGDGHAEDFPQYDGIATEYNIKQALVNMVTLADDNDYIAYITSGHGAGDGYGSSYICAWDCGSGESGEDGDFYDTELADILDDSIADKIFVFIDHCYSGGFGPDLMSMSNSDNVYLAVTCTDEGYGFDDSSHLNGMWTYYFLEYAWINHYSGSATVSMEDIFVYAHDNYPYTSGVHEPEEYDGDTSTSFNLA